MKAPFSPPFSSNRKHTWLSLNLESIYSFLLYGRDANPSHHIACLGHCNSLVSLHVLFSLPPVGLPLGRGVLLRPTPTYVASLHKIFIQVLPVTLRLKSKPLPRPLQLFLTWLPLTSLTASVLCSPCTLCTPGLAFLQYCVHTRLFPPDGCPLTLPSPWSPHYPTFLCTGASTERTSMITWFKWVFPL